MTIYISKRLRLPYYGHYINEASLYVKVHLHNVIISVIKEVALPPFFQKNIVVGIVVVYM